VSTNISPEILKHLKKDEKLKLIVDICSLEVHKQTINVFDDLIRSIVSQQLSTTAAKSIYNRFLTLFENIDFVKSDLLSKSNEDLRNVGLSYQKANYIKNVAEHFKVHDLHNLDWNKISDEDIIGELTKIKGVGKWTVEMILIFSLQRPDVFPIDDLVVRNNMIRLYQVTGSKKEIYKKLTDIAEQWKPYRSYASRYMWAAKDTNLFKV
jgi:DNA-3-methyladenine glycosylase II